MARVAVMDRKVTYSELESWPDDGRRYELYDGEVYVVPSPFPRHQIAMLELTRVLDDYAKSTAGLTMVSPLDIVFDEYNVLQPDIVVFTAQRRHLVQLDRATRVPPDVAVEVLSPGTADNDRGRKLRAYERFGVPEYWILDPKAETLEVLALRDGQYQTLQRAVRGETVTSSVLPGFSCKTDVLFPW